jgi:hypothetical protein
MLSWLNAAPTALTHACRNCASSASCASCTSRETPRAFHDWPIFNQNCRKNSVTLMCFGGALRSSSSRHRRRAIYHPRQTGHRLDCCDVRWASDGSRIVELPSLRDRLAYCVRHYRAPGSQRPVPFNGRILSGLMLDLRVELRSEENDDGGYPHPHHQTNAGSKRPTSGVVMGEICQISGEQRGGAEPCRGSEYAPDR